MPFFSEEDRVDISFCLPVYNVYPYLLDCMESIRNQRLEEHGITY